MLAGRTNVLCSHIMPIYTCSKPIALCPVLFTLWEIIQANLCRSASGRMKSPWICLQETLMCSTWTLHICFIAQPTCCCNANCCTNNKMSKECTSRSNITYSSEFRDTVFSTFGQNYTVHVHLECIDSYGDTSLLHSIHLNLMYNDDRSRTINVVYVDGVSNTIRSAHAMQTPLL